MGFLPPIPLRRFDMPRPDGPHVADNLVIPFCNIETDRIFT